MSASNETYLLTLLGEVSLRNGRSSRIEVDTSEAYLGGMVVIRWTVTGAIQPVTYSGRTVSEAAQNALKGFSEVELNIAKNKLAVTVISRYL